MAPQYLASIFVALVTLAKATSAQQFLHAPSYMPQGTLSDTCYELINTTTVSCEAAIGALSFSNNPKPSADLYSSVCQEQCYQDLSAARATIAAGCTNDDRVIRDDVSYPATYYADMFLQSYEVTCRKDNNGQFCDTKETPDPCDGCSLGLGPILLNSPIGYHPDIERWFTSATSSCAVSTLSWTTPTSYATTVDVASPTTMPAEADALPTYKDCPRTYKVQPGDTCDSIAAQQNVSTFSIVDLNGLDAWCTHLPDEVCLDDPCKTYVWTERDTCSSVKVRAGITEAQLRAWNPVLNEMCLNLNRVIGKHVCVSLPKVDASVIVSKHQRSRASQGASARASRSMNHISRSRSTPAGSTIGVPTYSSWPSPGVISRAHSEQRARATMAPRTAALKF